MKLKYYIFFAFLSCVSSQLFCQKELSASRISQAPEIDGVLSDSIWEGAFVASDFIINYPAAGVPSEFRTNVRLVYDNEAIYIGVELFDPKPDSVLATLSQRDDYGNADWFGVLIDPYGAGQNGFGFFTTAAGVELDAILSTDDEDFTWNSVWKSRVKLTDFGWTLEMRIPLSQLRFPEKDIQTWRINFKRQVRRNRQTSYWSPVDPQQFGVITQSGKLTNLERLKTPVRLSFSPYTTAYVENYYNEQSGNQEWRFRPRFGMDMKLGLSESFTLDATLVPDFGQTVSDRLVLNLSPFEVRYAENRPFFLEGIDLFGIGDLFYSRRIGDQTYKGAQVVDSLQSTGNTVKSAPSLAQLVNATKISGRTKKGLGVGVFNAIEKRSYVTYTDSLGNQRQALAHPLSNYNVAVLSQNLKNNGNVSLLNTNVFRKDVNVISNVTNAQFAFFSKNRAYSFEGSGQLSANQYQDSVGVGHTDYFAFSKVNGAITYQFLYYEVSNTFDPNELGFLPKNNYRGGYSEIKWTGYEPKGHFLRRSLKLSTSSEFLYAPRKFAFWNIEATGFGTFKNFLSCGFNVGVFPVTEVDHFESRTFGIPLNFPSSVTSGIFYSSDYSKKYALDFTIDNRVYTQQNMDNLDVSLSPRIRFSNRFFTVFSSGVSRYFNNYGFVQVNDTMYSNKIHVGVRNRWIVNNSISAEYTFTNRMGLIMKLNHYWQQVDYQSFRTINTDGSTSSSNYIGRDSDGKSLHNRSFNAFTVDLNFRWVVYPGSEILFVWKYNIYASKDGLDSSYFGTFTDLFNQPQLNSFSLKALFYLNAGKLFTR